MESEKGKATFNKASQSLLLTLPVIPIPIKTSAIGEIESEPQQPDDNSPSLIEVVSSTTTKRFDKDSEDSNPTESDPTPIRDASEINDELTYNKKRKRRRHRKSSSSTNNGSESETVAAPKETTTSKKDGASEVMLESARISISIKEMPSSKLVVPKSS